MWTSRRGLLAVGLAVTVAGALGIASIINAEADQVAPAADSAKTPPLLPWGAKPQKIRTGKAGTASDTLHAAGQVAAPADTSGAKQPRGRYAPKGRTAPGGSLRTEQTDIVPPQPSAADDTAAPGSTATSDGSTTVNYFYNVGMQMGSTEGIYANVSIGKPTLSTKDYHSLAELAVESADGDQIVEVGWTVDRVVNGDSDPHLFVYHWVNGKPTCYNGCGFEQVSDDVKPGDTVANGTAKRFGIQYTEGAWWISFDSEWIGFFPAKLWQDQGVTFDKAGLVQAFGEVAATSGSHCTQMGNGLPGTDESAAVLGSVSFLNGPTVAMSMKSTAGVYPVNGLSGRTFQYGGSAGCKPQPGS